jgi:hypothetical protein
MFAFCREMMRDVDHTLPGRPAEPLPDVRAQAPPVSVELVGG